MEIKFYATTDVGRQREHNEDNYLVDPKLRLFVVADGMGGHAAGEVASQIAVHELCRSVRGHADTVSRYATRDDRESAAARSQILSILEQAIQHACNAIFQAAQEDANKRGMGTTTTALLLSGERGFIAHVGDSRIYLVRQGQVHQITEDHSLVNELVRRGKIKRDEIDRTPYAKHKNALTRAVGANETVEADTFDFDVLPGDAFLVCSDGLHHYLRDRDIVDIIAQADGDATQAFIDLANGGGGHDNITALVVRITEEVSKVDSARASDLANRIEVLKRMPLFRHLDYKEIIRLLNVTVVKGYQPGERIIAEGEDGDELFVILGGKVRLHKGDAFVTRFERGQHFGEMALVDRSPRSASVTAEEPTRVLMLRRRDFYEIIRKEPHLATKLLWSFVQVLAQRLRKTTAELQSARVEAQAEELSSADVFDES